MVTEPGLFVHIGNNKIVSDKKAIGIFNRDSLLLSDDNSWIIMQVEDDDHTIALNESNNIIASNVSPFTVIRRVSLVDGVVWRRRNDKKLQR
jgi:regulator of extracellular matrix RemA (YlzA/DUF370 family)